MRPGVLLFAAAMLALAPDDPPALPAVQIRLKLPNRALEHVLALFKGSRASDPATALANWKRATKGSRSLGKGPEAAIAALNPQMARELATLNGSELVVDFTKKDGAALWSFAVPKDDGTFAAFATAMTLTDGASEPPIGAMIVDRLGKVGSPLMGRSGKTVVIGGSREGLTNGLALLERSLALDSSIWGNVAIEIDGLGLARSSRLDARRLGGAILGFGLEGISFHAGLVDDELIVSCKDHRVEDDAIVMIDAAWVADVPEASSLAFSIAIDARPAMWQRVFGALDGIEKADPKNVARSPIRARVGLLARLAGIDLERDLWPKLRGVTGFMIGTIREPEGIALALHVADDTTAIDLRDRVLPQLAKALRLDRATGPLPRNGARALANVGGQTVWVSTDAPRTVWIGWGEDAVPTAMRQKRAARLVDSEGFDMDELRGARALESLRKSSRRGWFYPNRLGLVPPGSPLGAAIETCGPILWRGDDNREFSMDVINWQHLDRGVRRFLDLIPQQPAPAPPK